MKRNIQNLKKRGSEVIKHNERCDLNVEELLQLMEDFKRLAIEQGSFDAVWETIGDAFHIGIAVGVSIEKRRNKKTSA